MRAERLSVRQWRIRRSERSGATSSIRSAISACGMWIAPSRWDSSHSFCSRTSMTRTPSAISRWASATGIISILALISSSGFVALAIKTS